ncbi:LysR family transcriptional regulator [Aquincola tertiaricarbonis]|uniref:LysR family transcriptional regulator n=1 Tax=Aquincola tertiaricarbonis TaxID=391953 RepID=UPI000614E27C|nr:LysR family transcriptional regulator [Aquincola tertiaricarbonis]
MPASVNFRHLDLNLLRVFDAVMHERNLTRAAENLSLSQSAVSHALKRLRTMLGDELLTRTAFGVVPTPKAEALWPSVRTALAQLEQAIAPAGFDPRTDTANFLMVMADATAVILLPPMVARLEALGALANLQVLPLTTRDPRKLLENNEVDVAIGYFPAAVMAILRQGLDSPLRRERLYESEYQCVMRVGHPLAEGELTLDGFCAAQHLSVSLSGRAHGPIDAALAALGRQRRVMLAVNQFFTAGQVVADSDLLTVLPTSFMRATGHTERLVTRPLPAELQMSGLQVELLWHSRHDDQPAHKWLRQLVLEACGRHPAGGG